MKRRGTNKTPKTTTQPKKKNEATPTKITDALSATAKGDKNSRGGGVVDLLNPSDNAFNLVSIFYYYFISPHSYQVFNHSLSINRALSLSGATTHYNSLWERVKNYNKK